MVLPIVLPRTEHTLSRRDVDPDALKVLYRLQQLGITAYLVGGSVRDLLLGRRPKDFDIGTSAQPHEIKRAFRNCWIIGRRFRLAHVKFGTKTIEVATSAARCARTPRRKPEPAVRRARRTQRRNAGSPPPTAARQSPPAIGLIQRDNVYGTPEEDAFRRDFTVNALFYDAADKTIIDYVGGLADLRGAASSAASAIRWSGSRKIRSACCARVVMAERLLQHRRAVIDAMDALGSHIRRRAPARLLEEYYKILRSGAAERVFQGWPAPA